MKQGDDRRAQVRQHRLEIGPDVGKLEDLRRPEDRHRHENERHHAAGYHERLVGSLGPQLLDEVHRHHRRGRVERRVHARHDGGHQRGDNEPPDADGQQVEHERWENQVRVCGEHRILGSGVEQPPEEAGQHHEEDDGQLQQPGKERAPPSVVEVFSAQGSLHHELVRSPEIESQQEHPRQQAGPGHHGVAGRQDDAQVLLGHRCLNGCPGAADGVEREHRYQEGADEQQHRRHRVGVDDGLEAACNRVDPCQDA